jgi:hypothetical protein
MTYIQSATRLGNVCSVLAARSTSTRPNAAPSATTLSRRRRLLDPPDDRVLMMAYGDILPKRASLLELADGSLDATVATPAAISRAYARVSGARKSSRPPKDSNKSRVESRGVTSQNVAMNQKLSMLVKSGRASSNTAFDGQAVVNRFQGECIFFAFFVDLCLCIGYLLGDRWIYPRPVATHPFCLYSGALT